MKKEKVIKPTNLPVRMPLVITLVFYLFLKEMNAPEWVWGVAGCFVFILWLSWVVRFFWVEKYIDIFEK